MYKERLKIQSISVTCLKTWITKKKLLNKWITNRQIAKGFCI